LVKSSHGGEPWSEQLHPDEVQKAKQLRDQTSTVAEYRKALSVLLSLSIALMRIALLTPWASVAAHFFAIEIKFALKMIHAKIHGAVAGTLPCPLKKNESFSPNGTRKQYREAS
jgi:hypothetical protein